MREKEKGKSTEKQKGERQNMWERQTRQLQKDRQVKINRDRQRESERERERGFPTFRYVTNERYIYIDLTHFTTISVILNKSVHNKYVVLLFLL